MIFSRPAKRSKFPLYVPAFSIGRILVFQHCPVAPAAIYQGACLLNAPTLSSLLNDRCSLSISHRQERQSTVPVAVPVLSARSNALYARRCECITLVMNLPASGMAAEAARGTRSITEMWLVLEARSKSLLDETASYEMHGASFHFSRHPSSGPGLPRSRRSSGL